MIFRWRSASIGAVFAIAFLGLAACDDDQAATEQESTDAVVPVTIDTTNKASLTMAIEPLGYLIKEGRHRYTQNRTFTESAGVGVTLTLGKVCVDHGKECVSGKVSYRVEPNSTASRRDQYVATKAIPDIATIVYTGTDDNGNPVTVSAEIELDIPKQPGDD